MNLFTLVAKVGLDTSDYEKQVNKTKSSANGLKSVFTSLSTTINNVGLKSKTASSNHKLFASELEKAKAKVKSLNDEYVKSVRETGATSDATRELQEKLREAKNDVSNLSAELDKYPSRLDKAKSATSKFGSALKSIGSVGLKGVTGGIGLLAKGAVAGVTTAGAAVSALGAIGLNYNSKMETYTTNFEVMLGSQEAAAKKVEELKTMAAKTPFEMGDLAKGTQTLLAFNVASEDSTGVLTKLGNISLGDSQKLESLTRAYGKMNAAQKVTLEDVNMMIDAGYNPLLNIQEKTGESMEDLYKRISDGEVSFGEIQDAIDAATSEGGQFYRGMEKASQTTAGLISTLKDNAQALVGEVFKPISQNLTSTLLPAAVNAIGRLTAAFEKNGVSGMVTAASDIVASFLTAFTGRLPEFITLAMNMLQTLGSGISQNLPSITNAAFQTFMAFVQGLTQMLPGLLDMALQMVMTLGQNLVANSPQIVDSAVQLFTSFIDTLIEWLPELVPLAFQIVTKLATSLIDNIPTIAEKVVELGAAVVDAIIQGISDAWDGLVSWFNGLWDSLFGDRTANVNVNATSSGGVDGSHANGLDYVPYNNYVANLHRGEMVLTAREAENYRNGGKTGGDMVFQISINGMQFTSVSDMAHALANDISHELEAQTRRKAALYG